MQLGRNASIYNGGSQFNQTLGYQRSMALQPYDEAARRASAQAVGAAQTLAPSSPFLAARAGSRAAGQAAGQIQTQRAAAEAGMIRDQQAMVRAEQQAAAERGRQMLGGLIGGAGSILGTLAPAMGGAMGGPAGAAAGQALGGAVQQIGQPQQAVPGSPLQPGEPYRMNPDDPRYADWLAWRNGPQQAAPQAQAQAQPLTLGQPMQMQQPFSPFRLPFLRMF